MPARYYDPTTYRFLSADPAPPSAGDPSSLNAFAYCLDDPIGLDDPSGADPPGKGIHKKGTKEYDDWLAYLATVPAVGVWKTRHRGTLSYTGPTRRVYSCHLTNPGPLLPLTDTQRVLVAAVVLAPAAAGVGLMVADVIAAGAVQPAVIGRVPDVLSVKALKTGYDIFSGWVDAEGFCEANVARNLAWVQYHISRGDPFLLASEMSTANLYYDKAADKLGPFGLEVAEILANG